MTTYKRSRTFDQSAGAYSDPNGIKDTVATATDPATYVPADFDGTNTVGTLVSGDVATGLASWPTATASSSAGSYVSGAAIVFTGTYQGQTIERTAVLTGTDGNETVVADGPLDIDTLAQIDVEAQADALGVFTFGWLHVLPPTGQLWKMVARAAGNVHLTFQDGTVDVLPMAQHEEHQALVAQLHDDTAIDVTVYEQENPPSY